MKPTLFLLGPSDIEGQSSTNIALRDTDRVKGTAQWSGLLPIQPMIMDDPTLRANSHFFLMGIHDDVQVPKTARFNLFNTVGDADASVTALRSIQAMENELRPLRCFNRAIDVFKTSRERLPKTLSNIPGCQVPRVRASNPQSFNELEDACDEFGAWPLIVRARGYHGGGHMKLLKDRYELEALKGEPWLYSGILLIKFVDFANQGKLYQKTRVIMVDGVPYARHSIISDRWAIHKENRGDLMDKELELCRAEERFLAYLRDDGLKEYGAVFNAIHERIGLDIFGIDFALVDGQMIVFEANACMSFIGQNFGADGRYLYLDNYQKALKRAVKKMLMRA